MSIELERNIIAFKVKKALRENLSVWRAKGKPEIEMLADYLIEALWETAATSIAKGPERGILAGVKVMETWID